MADPTTTDALGGHDLTAERVRALLDLKQQGPGGEGLQAAADAATSYVRRYRPELWDADGVADFPPDVELGAAMLAHRWWQRRSSPLGTADYSEFGASPVLRHDPDVAKLLGLGADGGFTFGAPTRHEEPRGRWFL